MSMIQLKNLTFSYPGSYENVFENLSLQLDSNWKLGLIGRNGRGKTTLLKLLSDAFPYYGTIDKKVHVSYFPFAVPDPAQMTMDAIQTIEPQLLLWKLRKEFAKLELDENLLYRPFNSLSNGEQTKILLCVLFSRDHVFLLIDEPTNHLDMDGRNVVSHYLQSKESFVLVSHDRVFLDGCVDHILTLDKAKITVQKGNFSSWYENKEKENFFELSRNEKLKKEITRLNDAYKQTSNWSAQVEKSKYGNDSADKGYIGHKAAKMMKRSKTAESRREKAMKEKSGLLKNIETIDSLKLHPVPFPSSKLAYLDKVCIAYPNGSVLSPVTFTISRGDKILLRGKNGTGKSSILNLLAGQNLKYTGVFQKKSGITISFLPQNTDYLMGSLDNFAAKCEIDKSLFKTILRKLDFSREQFEKDMVHYSKGQKKKVALAASLCQRAHLYIWDEPLNYIDIFSRIQIEEVMKNSEATILFVEHDLSFAKQVSTKIVTLS